MTTGKSTTAKWSSKLQIKFETKLKEHILGQDDAAGQQFSFIMCVTILNRSIVDNPYTRTHTHRYTCIHPCWNDYYFIYWIDNDNINFGTICVMPFTLNMELNGKNKIETI